MIDEYIYITNNKEAEKAAEDLSSYRRLAYDTEGTGLKIVGGEARLLLMQLATEDISYVFDARRIDTDILKSVLESKDILKIGHNLKYDYQITKYWTGIQIDNLFDTMLSYRLLTAGLRENGKGGYIPAGFRDKSKRHFPYKSLDFLCKKYLGISLDKSIRKSFQDFSYEKEFTEKQLRYAAEDAAVLHPLCDILSQELQDEGLIETALLEFQFISPVSEMELNGVCINKDAWRSIIASCQRQADAVAKEISAMLEPLSEQNTLFGVSTVNIKSHPQLLGAFEKLGYTLENTDVKTLKKCDHPLAAKLLKYREHEKLLSTYGESLLNKIDRITDRLHFKLHQLGADTGRLSSEDPNIQNMPNKANSEAEISFRECFQAPEGKIILTADYSQCELRILAEESKDPGFLEIFRSGKDLHLITAQQVFSLTDEDLRIYGLVKESYENKDIIYTPTKEELSIFNKVGDSRQRTKAVNFGVVYGLSAYSLAEELKISLSEAETILDNYFQTYTGIKRWLNRNGYETIANRFSKTIIGRKKYFVLADPADEEAFKRSKGAVRRMGNNQVIQGTNADITKDALIRLQKAYNNYDEVKLLFTVHDEIVSEAPIALGEEIAKLKAGLMKQAFHRFIKLVPVGTDDKVSVNISNHWSH